MDDSRLIERAVLRISRRVYAALSATPADLDSYHAVWVNSATRSPSVLASTLNAWTLTAASVGPGGPSTAVRVRPASPHADRLIRTARTGDHMALAEAVTTTLASLDDADLAGLMLEMGTAFTAGLRNCGGLTMVENANGFFDGIAASDRERALINETALAVCAIANGHPDTARQTLALTVKHAAQPEAVLARLLGMLVRAVITMHAQRQPIFPDLNDTLDLPDGVPESVTALVQHAVRTGVSGTHADNLAIAKKLANLNLSDLLAATWYASTTVGTNFPAYVTEIFQTRATGHRP